MRKSPSKLQIAGIGIISLSALIFSFAGHKYFLIYLLFIIIGLVPIGIDYHRRGELKKFVWMNIFYLLLFAVFIILQFKSTF